MRIRLISFLCLFVPDDSRMVLGFYEFLYIAAVVLKCTALELSHQDLENPDR